MAYINFKEEVYVAKNQLKKRKDNNKKITEEMIEHKENLILQYNKKYSFKKIENRTINTSNILKENDFLEVCNENIICSRFIDCKFYNIKFKECTFIGCTFEECDFGGGGVVFENCSFIKVETNKTPSLNIKDNLSCAFKKCSMYIKFLSCDISYMIIENSFIKDTSFELTDMNSIIIIASELKNINIVDVDLTGAKIIETYIEDFEFNDKLKSKLDEKSFIDKIKLRKKTKAEHEGIYMVYETIANKYNENNLKNNFGEYYYLCKNVQRKSLKPLPKILSYINWFTSGYGERVFAPLMSSLMIIVIFAIAYLILGIEIDKEVIKYGFDSIGTIDLKTVVYHFNESFNLSVGMFAGLGTINSLPASESHVLCNTETIIGVIMIGIGIGTLTRKLVR